MSTENQIRFSTIESRLEEKASTLETLHARINALENDTCPSTATKKPTSDDQRAARAVATGYMDVSSE